jgi:hypothetical protein
MVLPAQGGEVINWKLFVIASVYTLLVVFTLDYYGAPWWIRALFVLASVSTIRGGYQLGRIQELDKASVMALGEATDRRADNAQTMVVEEAPDDV